MHSAVQFVPKVRGGVEVGAPYRPLEILDTNSGRPCLHGARFVQGHTVMLEQV